VGGELNYHGTDSGPPIPQDVIGRVGGTIREDFHGC
jgi:hypothetical protein